MNYSFSTPLPNDIQGAPFAGSGPSPASSPMSNDSGQPLPPLDFGPLAPVPLIDHLTIDNLAKEFRLEPVQRANLHAFAGVGPSLSFAFVDLMLIDDCSRSECLMGCWGNLISSLKFTCLRPYTPISLNAIASITTRNLRTSKVFSTISRSAWKAHLR